MLINTNDALVAFCQKVEKSRYLTVDTEFMRDRTYWPRLCLVQVAGDNDIAAIDPLADGIDLAPLFALLKDPKILKVFHAARQDLEIFYNLTGEVPAPIADSQVMAMVCGFGDSVSYETLVSKLAKASIDKTSRFTDWSARPLSERQLSYALDDVRYLRPVFDKLEEQVKKQNRGDWLTEEMAILESPATYKLEPNEAWRRLKARIDKPKHFMLLKALAAWRERDAQRIDIPRNRVLRDEALLEIVYHAPQSIEDLSRVRGFSADMAKGRMGAGILAVIKEALAQTPEPLPNDFKRKILPGNIAPVADLLRVLLKSVADEQNIAPKLLASAADLDELAADDNADIPAAHGWRREVFGARAIDLKHGKLAIKLENNRVKFVTL